jgi:hypothetical protein
MEYKNMKIFRSSEIKCNPINRITTAQQDNKLDVEMVGNEKSAKLGTFSKVFNYYLKQTANDRLPQLLAWFFLKKQMVEEGFNADKFETLIFNNFIDKDKYTWNQMPEDERKSWMEKNNISGIDLNYKFPGANTPQGTTGYYVEDSKNGSSAHYYSPSTSKEPYNFGSYGMFMKSLEDNKSNKEKTLEKTNYFGMGSEGKKYWDQIQSGKIENNPEPKFKKR